MPGLADSAHTVIPAQLPQLLGPFWCGWQRGRGAVSTQAESHCGPGHLPAVPNALHLSEGAGSQKKEHMSGKQLSWAFPGLGVAQPPTLPHLGGSLVPAWGHRDLSPLYRHMAAARMLPTRMLNPSCLARHFPAPPDPLNYLCPRKPGAELGPGEREVPANAAFPSG